MKTITKFICLTLGAALIATASLAQAETTPMADQAKPEAKAKAYPLDTCIVSDEKLGADPGMKTFVFTHEGQEIKLCCKSCQKTFNKAPAKYLKKLAAAEKAKKSGDKK
jgi:hypothetical protein